MNKVQLISLAVSEEPIHSLGWTGCGDEDIIIVEYWLPSIDRVGAGVDVLGFDVVVAVGLGMPCRNAQVARLLDLGDLCWWIVMVECRVYSGECFGPEYFLVE